METGLRRVPVWMGKAGTPEDQDLGFIRCERHGDAVHAVALAGRPWPVREYVAKVRIARCTTDLDAAHEE